MTHRFARLMIAVAAVVGYNLLKSSGAPVVPIASLVVGVVAWVSLRSRSDLSVWRRLPPTLGLAVGTYVLLYVVELL